MKRSSQQIHDNAFLIEQSYFEYSKTNPLSILDVCCGTGDILSFLTKKMQTKSIGIDYSFDYTQEALKYKNIHVVQDDAFYINDWKKLNHQNGFDLIFNWYSSFAYFSKEKNQVMFKNSFNALNEDGVFIVEAYNTYDVLINFNEEFKYSKKYNNKIIEISRKSSIDANKRMLMQDWNFFMDGETKTYSTQSYLYFPDEVIQIIEDSGFKCVKISGVNNLVKKPFHIKDKRWIITAKK